VISICKTKADILLPCINRFSNLPDCTPERGPRIRVSNHGGFTLIELIVVMTLIGIIFFFAVPRIDSSIFTNSSRQVSNWIILHVKSLKSRAVAKQVSYVMEVDMGENRISCFAGPESNMDMLPEINTQINDSGDTQQGDGAKFNESPVDAISEKPKKEEFSLPDRYRIADVLFADGTIQTAGTVDILFYAKGYSDRAIIHVKDDDGNTISYIIEPFLSRALIKDDYVEF